MTPRDKKRIREHVQWTMMQIPPEFRRADQRAVIRQAIRIVKGVDMIVWALIAVDLILLVAVIWPRPRADREPIETDLPEGDEL